MKVGLETRIFQVYRTACFSQRLSSGPSFLLVCLSHSHTHTDTHSLTHAQVFPKNFITKGSHTHWNTSGKQGSCSWILNFPCLLCNCNCLSFLSAAPSVCAANKTYGNMKGGALPSLSSRDHLPGLAMATSGLCYILHKSSSCFSDALPHLGTGLICQVELPGKFFPFSKPYFLLPSVHFLPLVLGAPVMASDAADSQGQMPQWI